MLELIMETLSAVLILWLMVENHNLCKKVDTLFVETEWLRRNMLKKLGTVKERDK